MHENISVCLSTADIKYEIKLWFYFIFLEFTLLSSVSTPLLHLICSCFSAAAGALHVCQVPRAAPIRMLLFFAVGGKKK